MEYPTNQNFDVDIIFNNIEQPTAHNSRIKYMYKH